MREYKEETENFIIIIIKFLCIKSSKAKNYIYLNYLNNNVKQFQSKSVFT